MSFGPSPAFRHLKDESRRAMLAELRNAVAPILANNLLPHFTDHSVAHSDSLVELSASLADPLQDSPNGLSSNELSVLYAACYLHDIGMQYERAGQTQAIQQLNLRQPWEDLDEITRRDLLRQHHNFISAEMVRASVNSAHPPIGINLRSDIDSARVASLCAAHCIDTDSQLYHRLTQDGPGVRMKLISGLLRLADILDESRRRATREKERTLLLDMVAQTHWWRHYYTESVEFRKTDRTICVWFDFPPGCEQEYGNVIPELQMPWIEQEFARHRAVFNRHGFGWTIERQIANQPYSTTEAMPTSVMAAMLKELYSRTRSEEAAGRLAALEQFEQARPHIESRLSDLRRRKDLVSSADYLRQLAEIAFNLWDLGGKRSAWMLLNGPFERAFEQLQPLERLDIGTRLIEMMNEGNDSFEAIRLAHLLEPNASQLPNDDWRRRKFSSARITALISECAYDDAVVAIEQAMLEYAKDEQREWLYALAEEIHLLQGQHGRLPEPLGGNA